MSTKLLEYIDQKGLQNEELVLLLAWVQGLETLHEGRGGARRVTRVRSLHQSCERCLTMLEWRIQNSETHLPILAAIPPSTFAGRVKILDRQYKWQSKVT